MTLPLILQIQNATLDSQASLTDALRKAKIACTKLGLTDFGKWVDLELNGYANVTVDEFPKHRLLSGRPETFNPYHGWQALRFKSARMQEVCSKAPVALAIPTLEDDVNRSDPDGHFSYNYHPAQQQKLQQALQPWQGELRIRLEIGQMRSVLNSVRDILLNWTLEMETQGILGENLTCSQGDRDKSGPATDRVVSNQIHIQNVGSFVQQADHSTVHGQISFSTNLAQSARDLVQQVEQLLPASGFPDPVKDETRQALHEVHEAAQANDDSRLRKGLKILKDAAAAGGETLLKLAIETAVNKMLGS